MAFHVVIQGSVITPSEAATRILTDFHRRFTIDTPAFDTFRGYRLLIFF